MRSVKGRADAVPAGILEIGDRKSRAQPRLGDIPAKEWHSPIATPGRRGKIRPPRGEPLMAGVLWNQARRTPARQVSGKTKVRRRFDEGRRSTTRHDEARRGTTKHDEARRGTTKVRRGSATFREGSVQVQCRR